LRPATVQDRRALTGSALPADLMAESLRVGDFANFTKRAGLNVFDGGAPVV
jgi:hypothetical protein